MLTSCQTLLLLSHSVMSDSTTHWTTALRLPTPSQSPRACSKSCPLNHWCSPAISSYVIPFSSCLQSFPASESFPTSQLFASVGHSIGASALVLPMNIQGWFPFRLTGWSPWYPRDSQESSPAPQFESINPLVLSLLYGPSLTSMYDYWKNHPPDYMDLCQ